jgi:hypothetical protein
MNEKIIDKFHTIKINNVDFNEIIKFSKAKNIPINKIISESFNFYIDNKLFQEFTKSPTDNLLESKFKANNECIRILNRNIEGLNMRNQEQFNEIRKLTEKLIDQIKFQEDEIQNLKKMFIEIVGEGEDK